MADRPSWSPPLVATAPAASPATPIGLPVLLASYALVGAGAAIATVLFLWLSDAFSPTVGPDPVARAALAGAVQHGLLAFLLFVPIAAAVVLALRMRQGVPTTALVAVGGHLAAIVAAGVIAVPLIGLMRPDFTATPTASATPQPTATRSAAGGPPDCVKTFGPNSPLCAGAPQAPLLPGPGLPGTGVPGLPAGATVASDVITIGNLAKVGLGAVATTLVSVALPALLRRRPE